MKIIVDTDIAPIDLSMTIEDHWRFTPTISYLESETAGCAFHSTRIEMSAHAFTHVDAPWHVDPAGEPLRAADLARLCGPAVLLDISAVGEDRPITAAALADAGPRPQPGDRVLIRSAHERRHPTTTTGYWTRSPWLDADAAGWLADLEVSAVGYDFPQDRGIRAPYTPDFEPGELDDDWACHRLLLHREIAQIEYLTNLDALTTDHCTLFAVPLRLDRSDGSPVRAFAYPALPTVGDQS